MWVGGKLKTAGDIYKGTPDIEFEQGWSDGLGAILADGQKIKNNLLVWGIFPEKDDSVILLGFQCSINPQNLMKIVEPFLRKSKFLIFYVNYP